MLLLGASFVPPAGAKKALEFPGGEWAGSAVFTGAITKKDIFAAGNAKLSFTLEVKDHRIRFGEMVMKGKVKGSVGGDKGSLNVSGTLDLRGKASRITVSGLMDFSGSVTVEGLGKVPAAGSLPMVGGFSPTFVTCQKVIGDLATETRGRQRAAGFDTSVTASFVALRTGDVSSLNEQEESATILGEYKAIVEELKATIETGILTGDPNGTAIKISGLMLLLARIDALNARIAGLGGCDQPPEGFEKGLQDTLLIKLFQQLIQEIANEGGEYTAQALLKILGVGFRVGAVGEDVPGSAEVKAAASSLLTQFETWLEYHLAEASDAGDEKTMTDILVGAMLYGLSELEAKARAASEACRPQPGQPC